MVLFTIRPGLSFKAATMIVLMLVSGVLTADENIFTLVEEAADNEQLQFAAEALTVEDIETALVSGADVRSQDEEGLTVLHLVAAFNDRPSVVTALVEAGADVNSSYSEDAVTPLLVASGLNQNPEIIRVLIEAGADVDAEGPDGKTPLIHAIQSTDTPSIISALLDAGADPTRADDSGVSAWDYANDNPSLWDTDAYRELHTQRIATYDQPAAWEQYVLYEGFETETYEADYMREAGPTAEHVRIFTSIRNVSERTIVGIEFNTRYLNVFGDVLNSGRIMIEDSFRPSQRNPQWTYAYYENNPYIADQAYNRIVSSLSAGTLRIPIAVTRIAFEDGDIVSFPDDEWVEPRD